MKSLEQFICYKCESIMNPSEVLYSEVCEVHIQVYLCPSCGHEEESSLMES